MEKFDFKGCLVALVTPMTASGEIDEAAFCRLIDWHLAEGTQGFVIFGSTGESATISAAERETFLRLAVTRVAGRVPVIAGVGTNNTDTTIALAKQAEATQVDALLAVVPYYNKPPQRGLVRHFQALHEASHLPIILYNVPSRTVTDLGVQATIELAACPRIIGLKDASGDLSRVALLRAALPNFLLLAGNDDEAARYILQGGDGVISASGNVVPRAMLEITQAARAGQAAEANRLSQQLVDLHQVLFIEVNPIAIKAALQCMGKIAEGIRLPLVSLDSAHVARLTETLKTLEVL